MNKYTKGIDVESKCRGSKRYERVANIMVEYMLEMISDYSTISLKVISRRISEKHEADPPVSTTIVDYQLDEKSHCENGSQTA